MTRQEPSLPIEPSYYFEDGVEPQEVVQILSEKFKLHLEDIVRVLLDASLIEQVPRIESFGGQYFDQEEIAVLKEFLDLNSTLGEISMLNLKNLMVTEKVKEFKSAINAFLNSNSNLFDKNNTLLDIFRQKDWEILVRNSDGVGIIALNIFYDLERILLDSTTNEKVIRFFFNSGPDKVALILSKASSIDSDSFIKTLYQEGLIDITPQIELSGGDYFDVEDIAILKRNFNLGTSLGEMRDANLKGLMDGRKIRELKSAISTFLNYNPDLFKEHDSLIDIFRQKHWELIAKSSTGIGPVAVNILYELERIFIDDF